MSRYLVPLEKKLEISNNSRYLKEISQCITKAWAEWGHLKENELKQRDQDMLDKINKADKMMRRSLLLI